MQSVIVLFGKPGAGKGTRLSEFLEGREEHFEVLSVGNFLRKAINDQTELGKKVSPYVEAGLMAPDEIITPFVIEELKNANKTIFIDGFPRTIAQAEAMLQAGIRPAIVIEFYVDDKLVMERSHNRIVCDKCGEPYTLNDFKPSKVEGVCDKCGGPLTRRPDDEESVVLNRLKVYENKTYPVLNVLKNAGIPTCIIHNDDAELGRKAFSEAILNL